MICLTRSVVESIITREYPYRRIHKDVSPEIRYFRVPKCGCKGGNFMYLKIGNKFKKTVLNSEHFLF